MMIILEELESEIKRLELLLKNVEDKKEIFLAKNAIQGISQIYMQLKQISMNPNFDKIVEEND